MYFCTIDIEIYNGKNGIGLIPAKAQIRKEG